jgi:hypothetical protein
MGGTDLEKYYVFYQLISCKYYIRNTFGIKNQVPGEAVECQHIR